MTHVGALRCPFSTDTCLDSEFVCIPQQQQTQDKVAAGGGSSREAEVKDGVDKKRCLEASVAAGGQQEEEGQQPPCKRQATEDVPGQETAATPVADAPPWPRGPPTAGQPSPAVEDPSAMVMSGEMGDAMVVVVRSLYQLGASHSTVCAAFDKLGLMPGAAWAHFLEQDFVALCRATSAGQLDVVREVLSRALGCQLT